ncbi:AraC family transcriptional regulator [Ferrovibrio terrae]|uniref:AraC family transcriptional regulator n=1 Tax=Ferrovibrio terrae TaxID=2594003 RepID=UPI003137A60D
MAQTAPNPANQVPDDPAARLPTARVIARGADWTLSEFVCRSGPQDRPFEEQHDFAAIAAVVEGSFQYRCDSGRALLYPGAFLLGNPGGCFECGHDHSTGDRCVSLQFTPALFEEIAASAAGSHRFRFTSAMLPALKPLIPPVARLEAMAAEGGSAVEELAFQVAETVIDAVAGGSGMSQAPSHADARRISRVLHHIAAHATEPLDLAQLAGIACMSKYHFLRSFRRSVGVTPHQYLLGLRLRLAARRLLSSTEPVSSIAFDTGFGDLSTFNANFRAQFGTSPGSFRRAHSKLMVA